MGHTVTATPRPRPPSWRAGPDGIGHALTGARFEVRHPCGASIIAERLAHPAATRCPECLDAVGVVVQAPLGLEVPR